MQPGARKVVFLLSMCFSISSSSVVSLYSQTLLVEDANSAGLYKAP